MGKPNVAVLYAPGINCHEETCYALEYGGAKSTVLPLSDLLQGTRNLDSFEALVLPGGSSWGDYPSGGRVFGIYLVSLEDMINEFIQQGKPVLGIANGCQVLVEAGILSGGRLGVRTAALAQNQSARFESRWANVFVEKTDCIWTKGLEDLVLRMPVSHSQGRFVFSDGASVTPALIYVDDDGDPTSEYPANPTGSTGGIAGIVDKTGLVMGMMVHPERAVLTLHGSTDGLRIFANMIRYCRDL